jgi:hypothetical protein
MERRRCWLFSGREEELKRLTKGGLIFCSLKKGENKKSNKNKEGVKKFSPSI